MKITFHGGAREVGGSCTVVETRDASIALDYGIKVDAGLSYTLPDDVDAIAVSHAHLDHSGNLLTVAEKDIVIVGSMPTRDVTLELLRDMIKIHKLNGSPLPYSFRAVNRLSRSWATRNPMALPGMEISLYPAGHVLGAKMVQLRAGGKTILYTGDFCLHDTEILNGVDLSILPKEPDILIMESTYGGTVRPSREMLVKALFEKILETMDREGNILIPAFAFHRLQEMARRIEVAMREKILPQYNAYYISGLAHRLFQFYQRYKPLLAPHINQQSKPFRFSRVKRVKRMNQIREPALVICTSGFGHAGASYSLLYEWAMNAADTVIINTGYLPPQSPLLMAMDGVLINDGKSQEVAADVEQIELSGHADQEDLTEFIHILRPKQTFLVHGDAEQAQALSEKIYPFTDVVIPANHESYAI